MQTSDVVIIGAGLSGLRAAQLLGQRGWHVIVLDRHAEVGGRLASRNVDGYVIDEGFQLVNPSYPELRATKVLETVELRPFEASLLTLTNGRRQLFSDPRASLRGALSPFVRGGLSFSDARRLGSLGFRCGFAPIRGILRRPDESTWEGFAHTGISPRAMNDVVRPFLRGTLLDDQLESSWHFTQLVLRSFVRGRPGTFADGVVALPRAMARQLDSTVLKLDEEVISVTPTRVVTNRDEYESRAVVLATDATDAARLGTDTTVAWRAQTTWWIAAPKIVASPILHIDLDEPLLTSVLDVSAVARERAPTNASLVAAPAVGALHERSLDARVLESVARTYDVATSELSIIERTVVERALPATPPPLRLNRPQRRGEIFLAGDYLQTPSIQGALVSGRRAAQAILAALT